jgi:hypothetical protein
MSVLQQPVHGDAQQCTGVANPDYRELEMQ